MSEDKHARLKQWLKSGEARLQPLSLPQRELWEASPAPPTDESHHICCLIHVRGTITQSDCIAAIQNVSERQEVLRLSFLPGKDQPLQMVRRAANANIGFRELSSADSRPERVEELAEEVFRQRFDLVQGPLYRVEVFHRGNDEHAMALSIHHSIADGWTLGVFIQDLCIAYVQERMGMHGTPLSSVALTHSDWSAAERAFWQPAEIQSRLPFWKKTLEGYRRLWSTREQPKAIPGKALRWVSHLPHDLATAAQELARSQGTTLYSTLLAVFQLTVARWAGVNDILVGSPVANRGKQAVRETMGYFAGIVPIRGQVDFEQTFADSLRSVDSTVIDCFANALPFAELARELGDPPAVGYNPIFEIRFALQNHPIPDVDFSGLSAKLEMRSTGTPRFDLACEITEQKAGMEVVWLFRSSLFARKQIEELDRLFQSVLAGACRSPASKPAV